MIAHYFYYSENHRNSRGIQFDCINAYCHRATILSLRRRRTGNPPPPWSRSPGLRERRTDSSRFLTWRTLPKFHRFPRILNIHCLSNNIIIMTHDVRFLHKREERHCKIIGEEIFGKGRDGFFASNSNPSCILLGKPMGLFLISSDNNRNPNEERATRPSLST